MKTRTLKLPFLHRCLLATLTPLLLALVLMQPGCVTRQVAKIVTESNAAMLAGQFGLPELNPGSSKPAWQEASDSIDAFVAAHPDQPDTTAPLRIRQAMLLLGHRQISLAEAAFNAAASDKLHGARDQAIKRNQDTLIWWFASSTNATWLPADQAKATKALKDLKDEQSKLAESPDIRDYLAEMRAWIGLAKAKQTTSTTDARQSVEDALNVYAGIFTPEDLKIIKEGRENQADPGALGPAVRRRLRAKAVLAEAKKRNRDDSLDAHPATAEFSQLIN